MDIFDEESDEMPHFTIVEDEHRGKVKARKDKTTIVQFRPGDRVYIVLLGGQKEGPYIVASRSEEGKYVLAHDDGTPYKGGNGFQEPSLVAA